MNYISSYLFTLAIIAVYIATALGVFFILRRKARLGYALLISSLLFNLVPTFIEGLVPAGIDLTIEAAIFIGLVAGFASRYELIKRSKRQTVAN